MRNISSNNNLKKILIGSVLPVLILFAKPAWSQDITILEYPFFLVNPDDVIRIRWTETIEANLYFGVQHGQYDRQTSVSGTNILQFSPSSEGITPGIYYCRISNGLLHSIEFPLYIESALAPVSRTPQSGAEITSVSIKFEWDAVSGVPFYHFILSDQPVQIVRDGEGELSIEGSNIIYQAITGRTELYYGQPDPSGFFNQVNGILPPLLNSKTYNWIILNNYGNHPALSSIVQSGIQSFTVNVQVNLSVPTLVSPANGSQLSDEIINFSWQPVSGVNNYQFELFEILEKSGSSSTFPIWQVVTTNTNIQIPARQIFKSGDYQWHVIALDVSGKGIVSAKRNFTYYVPAAALSILTRTISGNSLPRVNIKVKPIQGSGENNDYLSSDSGILILNVQPGRYQIIGSKPGFKDKTVTIYIEVNQAKSIFLDLELLSRAVTGNVVSNLGEAIPNAEIYAIDAISRIRKQITSDIIGSFRFPLPVSSYQIYALSTGYSPSDTIQVDLTSATDRVLASPLVLKKYTGEILGNVINQNSIAIFGARIIAQQKETKIITTSDANGSFKLTMGAGTWNLIVMKAGYSQDNIRSIMITENQIIMLNPGLILNSQAAIISGLITDGNIGIEKVSLRAVPSQGNSFFTTSNAKGRFNLSVTAGSYDIYFRRNGYFDPMPQQVEVNSRQTLNDLIVSLTKVDAEVSGFIKCGPNPVSGAILTSGYAADTSRINGFYKIILPAGNHQIDVFKVGYFQSQPKYVSLKSGDIITDQDIELSPQAAVIKGGVSSNGLVVGNAIVMAIQNNDTSFTFSAENGNFVFSLPSGIWNVYAEKEGFAGNSFDGIALQPGQIIQGIQLEILPNYGTVVGHVQDNLAYAIPQTKIVCEERQKLALTDDAGNYKFELSPGSVTLKIVKKGYVEQLKTVSISTNVIQTENFTLTSLATVKGKITDSDGTPVNRTEVLAVQQNDTLTNLSDYTGEYLLYIPGGDYTLFADKLGYSGVQQQISVQNGQILIKNIQLQFKPEEFAQIKGKIKVDDIIPLPSAVVIISGKVNKSIQTDIYGDFLFDDLESGFDYTIRPSLKSYFFIPDRLIYQPLSANETEQNFIASLFGDLSANQEVSSFDGSLILRIAANKNISPYFTSFPRDSTAADVSGNGRISSFDASLVFRFSAGLIDSFPAEYRSYPAKRQQNEPGSITVFTTFNRLDENSLILNILTKNEVDFFALDTEIYYSGDFLEPVSLKLPSSMKKMARVWTAENNVLRVALAGFEKVQCCDSLLSLVFKPTRNAQKINENQASIVNIDLDEGFIHTKIEKKRLLPEKFHLSQNYPNPFNQSTVIKLRLPEIEHNLRTKLKIVIYNLLGQKINTLADEYVLPGYYSFFWFGQSDSDIPLASGVYLIRVNYGQYNDIKKLLLVR